MLIPSVRLIYIYDSYPALRKFRVKILGHQWFWEYENFAHRAQGKNRFRSYITPLEKDFKKDMFRLLDSSRRLLVPVEIPLRALITSDDVLHSWAVPALGVKADACPGRLNEILLYARRTGLFFGQCSEICGANHRFIPIIVKAVRSQFWLN